MKALLFLTLAEVVEIHKDQIDRYGGHPGIRDYDLLSSAIAAPQATWNSEYLNSDILEMAAAYIFYICQDHPFIDGNKRTALASGLVYLEINGISIMDENGALYPAVMSIALGQLGKSEMAAVLRGLVNIKGDR
jgi:death-on-curing protein